MKNLIFYFSGTGNSLRTAKILAREIGGARLVSMAGDPAQTSAEEAKIIGFVCPVYEWDVPQRVQSFIRGLTVNPGAYIFLVVTYAAVHGRSFETVSELLRKKGAALHYGKALRCVASQCIAYEPFPFPRLMVPRMEKGARKIGKELAAGKQRKYPKISLVTKFLHSKWMTPFLNIQEEYDKGFYTSSACVGCEVCRKVCPCKNITFSQGHPVWNHRCEGCNACVVYCPTKAVGFRTPDAYARLNNIITRRLGLPEKRTRYHNPYIHAADLIKDSQDILPPEAQHTEIGC